MGSDIGKLTLLKDALISQAPLNESQIEQSQQNRNFLLLDDALDLYLQDQAQPGDADLIMDNNRVMIQGKEIILIIDEILEKSNYKLVLIQPRKLEVQKEFMKSIIKACFDARLPAPYFYGAIISEAEKNQYYSPNNFHIIKEQGENHLKTIQTTYNMEKEDLNYVVVLQSQAKAQQSMKEGWWALGFGPTDSIQFEFKKYDIDLNLQQVFMEYELTDQVEDTITIDDTKYLVRENKSQDDLPIFKEYFALAIYRLFDICVPKHKIVRKNNKITHFLVEQLGVSISYNWQNQKPLLIDGRSIKGQGKILAVGMLLGEKDPFSQIGQICQTSYLNKEGAAYLIKQAAVTALPQDLSTEVIDHRSILDSLNIWDKAEFLQMLAYFKFAICKKTIGQITKALGSDNSFSGYLEELTKLITQRSRFQLGSWEQYLQSQKDNAELIGFMDIIDAIEQ